MTETQSTTDIQIYARIEGSPLERADRLKMIIADLWNRYKFSPGQNEWLTLDWEAIQ